MLGRLQLGLLQVLFFFKYHKDANYKQTFIRGDII